MLTIDYRPKVFSEIVGQEEAVSVMMSVVKNPETAPRSYIFHGERGLGKTTLVRVFSRALFCGSRRGYDSCLKCSECLSFTEFSPRYQEYDVTQVGNVSFMRQLKDNLIYSPNDSYRVVVFDESHSASVQSMNVLLKLIEEGPRNTFFIFCTTELDKMLDTIRSRSLELFFPPVSDIGVKVLLSRISKEASIAIDEVSLMKIVSMSSGFVREAVMKLDLYRQLQDPERFNFIYSVSELDVIALFSAALRKDRVFFEAQLKKVMSLPLVFLKKMLELFVLNSIKVFSGGSVFYQVEYTNLVTLYGDKVFSFLNIFSSSWAQVAFKSDSLAQALLWYVYYFFSEKGKEGRSEESRFLKK